MSEKRSFFEKYFYEAPEDESPPDDNTGNESEQTSNDPPDTTDDGAPDMNDFDDSDNSDDGDSPPDIGGFDDTDNNGDDNFGMDDFDDNSDNSNNSQDLHLDDKVSAIMNMNLYQRYLSLLTTIKTQLTMIRDNNDILRTLSPDSLNIVDSLKKLEENINLYIKNNFTHENYSKNLLFFNKCLNLLKLLNDVFDKDINSGIKGNT